MSPAGTFLYFIYITATCEITALSLHDALPISVPSVTTARIIGRSWSSAGASGGVAAANTSVGRPWMSCGTTFAPRSEEHTSELQSQFHLVCRLLLEKKKRHCRCTQKPAITPTH